MSLLFKCLAIAAGMRPSANYHPPSIHPPSNHHQPGSNYPHGGNYPRLTNMETIEHGQYLDQQRATHDQAVIARGRDTIPANARVDNAPPGIHPPANHHQPGSNNLGPQRLTNMETIEHGQYLDRKRATHDQAVIARGRDTIPANAQPSVKQRSGPPNAKASVTGRDQRATVERAHQNANKNTSMRVVAPARERPNALRVAQEHAGADPPFFWLNNETEGKKHGPWRITTKGGGVEEGVYDHGKRQGHWKFRDSDGTVGTGEFRDGKRHGVGNATFADGVVQESLYKDGKEHGFWKTTFADGSKWEFEFRDGKKTGERLIRGRTSSESSMGLDSSYLPGKLISWK